MFRFTYGLSDFVHCFFKGGSKKKRHLRNQSLKQYFLQGMYYKTRKGENMKTKKPTALTRALQKLSKIQLIEKFSNDPYYWCFGKYSPMCGRKCAVRDLCKEEK